MERTLNVHVQSFFGDVVLTMMLLYTTSMNSQASTFNHNRMIESIRDSLEAIQYTVPVMNKWKPSMVVEIRTQEQWDGIKSMLGDALKRGERNIELRVKCKNIIFGEHPNIIQSLSYPDANIRIVGEGAELNAFGYIFTRNGEDARVMNEFYLYPYELYNIDDLVLGDDGNEIPLRSEVKLVNGDVVKVKDDIWRFHVDLPDLSEEQCKDFYVLITRDWTSARHKVVEVKDGWLFYHLDSVDYSSDRNPNVDWMQYKVRPRYRFINNPISKSIHIVNGTIFIPQRYKSIKIVKGGQLLTFSYCHLNSLEICGFKLNGCGKGTAIGIYSSSFENGAFIYNNFFDNLTSLAVCSANSKNVTVCDNNISNTRSNAIEGSGIKTTICRNKLSRIGWMLNSRAIIGGGDSLYICENIIEDFNYSGISCGSRAATQDSVILNFIIERNYITQNSDFLEDYMGNTLADGGAIMYGPSGTHGIIRNNVINRIGGIHSNRGIFLDDGAKNVAIYGNLVMGVMNSYDIDLRLCETFMKTIPDHNTHNTIFYNIMTGGYRFQDNGEGSFCVGGQNILLGIGKNQNVQVELWKQENSDAKIEGCRYRKGRILIPRKYKKLLKDVKIDNFASRYIKFY